MLTHTIFADVIWPALFLQNRLLSTWIILAGLVIEYFVVWRVTSLGAWRSILADVGINIASTILGMVLIPLAGLAWAFFPGIFLAQVFYLGAFHPGTWAVTFCMAVLINAALEMSVLRIWFQQQFGKYLFGWLCLANALSVGLAMASFLIYPARY